MEADPKNIKFVCEGLDHPEGLALDAKGDIYAGGEAGQIYRINASDGTWQCIANTGGFILGVTLDGRGRVYACDAGRREIMLCLPDGKVETYASGTKDMPLVNPNYSAFDAGGHLFFSDSGKYWEPSGRLWVVEPQKPARPLTPAKMPFPNGICLDTEEGYLYVALSTAAQIVRYRVDGGSLAGGMEIVAELPSVTVPDGIALDNSRNLWLGCYVPDEIWRVSSQGAAEVIMNDRTGEILNRPTNVALAPNKVFFANLGGWHIGAFDVPVQPLPLHYPVL